MMLSRRALILALGLALAGCSGGLLPKPPPPPDFYRLSPADSASMAVRPVAVQLLVGEIAASGALDTARIALTPNATRVEYYADAEWTDRAPVLVDNLLLDTLQRSGHFARVARRSLTLRADYLVVGTLRHFEADYSATTPPRVRVAVELQLLRVSDGTIVAARRFTAAVPAGQNTVPAVAAAFDVATHQALHDVPSWIAGALPGSPSRHP
jgi:cholesterol transport system auxiliary component